MEEFWRSDELAMRMREQLKASGVPMNDGDDEVAMNLNGDKKTDTLTKSQLKKLSKGKLEKDQKFKAKQAAKAAAAAKKADGGGVNKKEVKKVKETKPVAIVEDKTPAGEKKYMDQEMPKAYQPKYVESAWGEWWEKASYGTPTAAQLDRLVAKKQDKTGGGAGSDGADGQPQDSFVMVIPPPNVTGSLHLGHALTIAIEDTLSRYHRMTGRTVCWVPGMDHAGIATQSVVEKMLKRTEGVTKYDLGREKFVERVWEWKENYGGKILRQLRRLGASVDWTRESFTMDDNLSRAVTEAFCQFHESGILYRDTRLVNWSPSLKSAISDIEVDYIDLDQPTMLAVPGHTLKKKYEFGTLTSFAYKVERNERDGPEVPQEIVVATTRLETMLGDTAVAVHPDDPRYKALHGRFVLHPFCGRRLPVVCDGELVEMDFGTGAVKITPAHDPNDYECGKRHSLPMVNILDDHGAINDSWWGIPPPPQSTTASTSSSSDKGSDKESQGHKRRWWWQGSGKGSDKGSADKEGEGEVAGEGADGEGADEGGDGSVQKYRDLFSGLMRYDARVAVEEEMEKLGIHRGKEGNKMRLGLCSRSNDIIEPMLKPQWWVDCADMAKRAGDCVRGGELKIVPAHHEATWFRWMDNIRPWCISRQLWWGHRIPAYFATKAGEKLDSSDIANNARWIVARTREEAVAKAAEKLSVKKEDVELAQDEDVLDTWFSSGLFPFSVFGWPNQTKDLDALYPTSLLETGSDILFFWVARMVMMGLQLTDRLPFSTVYLHSMVRDKYGRKMSKSLGNVIDPLEVIDGCTLEELHKKLEQGNLPPKEVEKAKKGQSLDYPDGIPECGTDALRFGLLAYTSQGRDINLDIQRVVGYRNFCNKLWNAVRFAMQYLQDIGDNSNQEEAFLTPASLLAGAGGGPGGLSRMDVFILNRLNATIVESRRCFQEYDFGTLAQCLYSFWLYDLCDVYLEAIKPTMKDQSEGGRLPRKLAQGTLFQCLDVGLRLLHPMMPYVTEELWQRLLLLAQGGGEEAKAKDVSPASLSKDFGPSIMVSKFPEPVEAYVDANIEAELDLVKSCVHGARSMKEQYNLTGGPAQAIVLKFVVKGAAGAEAGAQSAYRVLQSQAKDIQTLSKATEVVVLLDDGNNGKSNNSSPIDIEGCAFGVISDLVTLYLPLKGLVDFGMELQKLEKQLGKVEPVVKKLEQKRANWDQYCERVPEDVRAQEDDKLREYKQKLDTIAKGMAEFRKMLG